MTILLLYQNALGRVVKGTNMPQPLTIITFMYPSALTQSNCITAAVSVDIFNRSMVVFKQSTALLVSQQTKKNMWPFFLLLSPPSLSNIMALVVLLFWGDVASDLNVLCQRLGAASRLVLILPQFIVEINNEKCATFWQWEGV